MKYLFIILITCITNGCLGQYPKAAINKKGKVYNSNAQTKNKKNNFKSLQEYGHPKPVTIEGDSIILLNHNVDEKTLANWDAEDPKFYRQPEFAQFDSSKFYWSKQVYWEEKMNGELVRLNKKGHAKDISKNLLRYQDSAIKYELLLYKIRKQK